MNIPSLSSFLSEEQLKLINDNLPEFEALNNCIEIFISSVSRPRAQASVRLDSDGIAERFLTFKREKQTWDLFIESHSGSKRLMDSKLTDKILAVPLLPQLLDHIKSARVQLSAEATVAVKKFHETFKSEKSGY